MDISLTDLQNLISSAVSAAVSPIEAQINAIKEQAAKAEAEAQAQAQAAQHEEAAEMAEATRYISGMKQRLIAAGLLPTDNTNV